MTVQSKRLTVAACASLLLIGGVACGGAHGQPKAPATAAAGATTPGASGAPLSQLPPPSASPPHTPDTSAGPNGSTSDEREQGDAELVVSRDVVARCPVVRLVREHVDEFDPDMVWLAVLESIAECMSEDGPMAAQSIMVSGDEEHRHVVREVLASRGVAPTRVVAQPASAGAAECQGDTGCSNRVEITVAAP